jgi:dihydropteroate synthase
VKKMAKIWQTARREFDYAAKTLVMGILNVTPDSFSDGGKFATLEAALRRAEKMIEEGADVLDIGGESTRPNAEQVSLEEEMRRVVPIVEAVCRRFDDIAVSIDTTKADVAQAALNAGAEIINDISGLKWNLKIAEVAAKNNAGLILMHLRGDFATMHKQPPVEHILPEVIAGLRRSVETALQNGVKSNKIAVDIGIGFGKTSEQNLELLAKIDEICHNLNDFPVLVGTSRKSFIGKILNQPAPADRIHGTTATMAIAVFNGANIVRAHDVKAAVECVRLAEAIRVRRK